MQRSYFLQSGPAALLGTPAAPAAPAWPRALASIDAEIGKAQLDWSAVWTNDFVGRANTKHPKE